MLNKKIISLIMIYMAVSSAAINAQQMKSSMPAFDISGKQLETYAKVAPRENSILDNSFTENLDSSPANNYNEPDITSANLNIEKRESVQKDENTSTVDNQISSASPPLQEANQQVTPQKNDLNFEPEKKIIDPKLKQKFMSHNSGIKREADEIEFELRIEEKEVLKDLRLLWSAAVENSTAIRLAIQKLSNPDEADQIEKNVVQKMLSPLANAAPLAAMVGGSATTAAGALVGGGMLGSMSSDIDQRFNKEFLRVSDYDLIMLAKEVDELQGELVIAYYEYIHALKRYEAAEEAMRNAKEHYLSVRETDNFAANTAADAFFREAKQNQLAAKQNFLSARTHLEQITGNDVIVYVERLREKRKKMDQEAAANQNPSTTTAGNVKEELSVEAKLNEKNPAIEPKSPEQSPEKPAE